MVEPAKIGPVDRKRSPGASQVAVLLASATAMLEEEFKRSERLDSKSRNLMTIVAAFYAVVQAAVIGLINGLLVAEDYTSSFVVWLAISGGFAGLCVVYALAGSWNAWKLRDEKTIGTATLTQYLDAARDENPLVGVRMVEAYTQVIDSRRTANSDRITAVDNAAERCAVAIGATAVQLVLAFVAVAVQ
jgi:ABC-type xylose transport system permease subunit